jgi:hypothetical protein
VEYPLSDRAYRQFWKGISDSDEEKAISYKVA